MRVEQEEERRRERQRVEMIVRDKEGEIEAARSRDRVHMVRNSNIYYKYMQKKVPCLDPQQYTAFFWL